MKNEKLEKAMIEEFTPKLTEDEWRNIEISFFRSLGNRNPTDEEWASFSRQILFSLALANAIREIASGNHRFAMSLRNGFLTFGESS